MSYYNEQQQWSAPGSQSGWESQTPPARSGASSVVPREEQAAFSSQLEEVDRAVDNLIKSGKMFPAAGRRDSMPMSGGRPYSEFDPRLMGGVPRHQSVSDFGTEGRSFSQSTLQNFYANQRHQPPRSNEAEQVLQAKRRMAAQRERELRNYHQEQQYNRSVLAEMSSFGSKSERSMSPASNMTDDDRRDLITRQRTALYGESSDDGGSPRPMSQGPGATSLIAGRGQSPLAFGQGPSVPEGKVMAGADPVGSGSGAQRSRANSSSSPSSQPTGSFSLFDSSAPPSNRTTTSSPGTSPPRAGGKSAPNAAVAPIGTRPAGQAQALNKRSTTPLPSPLSHGYGMGAEKPAGTVTGDRSSSAASNKSQENVSGGLGWGNKSAGSGSVWSKNSLGVQASVWG